MVKSEDETKETSKSGTPVARVTVVCSKYGAKVSREFCVGDPESSHHPIHFQCSSLKSQDIETPSDIINAMIELQKIAARRDIALAYLVSEAFAMAMSRDMA